MDSMAAHLKQLSTEAERTYDILFDQDTVNGFADALTGLLGIFNNLLAGLGGGTNDFIYFGSIVTNIFKKQIADGINNTIDNIDKMKQNICRCVLASLLCILFAVLQLFCQTPKSSITPPAVLMATMENLRTGRGARWVSLAPR